MKATFQNTEVTELIQYTSQDFLFRLKSLRNLVVQKSCDAILIINGPHGGENEEASKLTNWLFQGFIGHKLFTNTVEDEMWDESMFLITKNKFYGFLYPTLYNKYITFFLQIPNAYFYVPTQEEVDESPDDLENTKVREFLRFINDYAIFCVPAKGNRNMQVVEKWPMIQAYAIDGVGGGFFTQRNRVVDVYTDLYELYMKND